MMVSTCISACPSNASCRALSPESARSQAARTQRRKSVTTVSLRHPAVCSRPATPLFCRVLFFQRALKPLTKKFIIVLWWSALRLMGVLIGNGLLCVHEGLAPPPPLSRVGLEKPPKPPPSVPSPEARGTRHALD